MGAENNFIPGEKYCFAAKDGQYHIGTFLHMNAVGRAVLKVDGVYWYVWPGHIFRTPVSEEDKNKEDKRL